MKFLITGFTPFADNEENPSSMVLGLIAKTDVEVLKLDVSYLRCQDMLEAKIKEVVPDIVICLGLASKRSQITPELCAINYMYAQIADNDGVLMEGRKIDDNGPNAYFTKLDLISLIKYLKENDIDASLSTSAGTYVCNSTYYHLLSMEEKYGFKGLFIHIPPLNVINLDNLSKALTKIITFFNFSKSRV